MAWWNEDEVRAFCKEAHVMGVIVQKACMTTGGIIPGMTFEVTGLTDRNKPQLTKLIQKYDDKADRRTNGGS